MHSLAAPGQSSKTSLSNLTRAKKKSRTPRQDRARSAFIGWSHRECHDEMCKASQSQPKLFGDGRSIRSGRRGANSGQIKRSLKSQPKAEVQDHRSVTKPNERMEVFFEL